MKVGKRYSCLYCPAPTSKLWWAGEPRLSCRRLEEGERSLSGETGSVCTGDVPGQAAGTGASGKGREGVSALPLSQTQLLTGQGLASHGHVYSLESYFHTMVTVILGARLHIFIYTLYINTHISISTHVCDKRLFFNVLWIYSLLINPTSIIFLSSVPETPLPLIPPARLGWETWCVLNRHFATVLLALREKPSVSWDCKRHWLTMSGHYQKEGLM